MTTKAKHTPGPWGRTGTYVIADDGARIATAHADARLAADAMDMDMIAHYNARLIAAAPELLEALLASLPFVEDALESLDFKPGHVKRIAAQVRAAIAKAEGSES